MKSIFLVTLTLILLGAGAARSQTVGGGSMTTFPGAPSGSCLDPQQAKDNSNGDTYSCLNGGWIRIGPTISAGTTSLAGCGVEWTGNYNFTVGACTYSINGINYNSPLTNLTLTTPDPTLDRIDVIYVDNTGTAAALAGTPAATPLAPTVDPTTQLQLTFIYVTANTTAPVNVVRTDIYHTGLEWTATKSGIPINLTSTNNPYDDTKDVEATAAVINNWAQFAVPAAGTIDLATRNALVFYLRSKATWSPTRSLTIQWMNGATAKGTPIVVKDGQFGFNSAATATYQQISIPTASFGINGIPVTQVRFTVSGPAGVATIGFYLDDITLQGGIAPSTLPTGVMIYRGAYSTSTAYNPNDVVTSGGKEYIALLGNTNVALTTVSTWQLMTSAIAGSVTGSGTNPKLAIWATSTAVGDIGTPTICSSGQAPRGIDANGNVTGCASTTPGSGTNPKLAIWATGTTLGNIGTPTLCSAGQAPTGIDANGNATGCAPLSSTVNHGLVFTADPTNDTNYLPVPFACTISQYTLVVDAGTVTVKFWKIATGTVHPTSSDSISTSGVSLSSGTLIRSTTLSDFTTTAVTANDVMAMHITAQSGLGVVTGVLKCDQ